MPCEGTLGVIGCPVLEDEMIYCLEKDADIDHVFVIRNEHCNSLLRKMEKRGLDFCCVPEDVFFMGGYQELPDTGFNWVIWMKDLGLHEEPKDLRQNILSALRETDGVFDAIMLFYGLCGNAFKDIDVWASEKIRTPVVILSSRDGKIVDDCIAAAIGGQDNYLRLLRKYPGILYFTPGFATNWDELTYRMEMFRGIEKGDDSMIRMIFEMADYDTVMKIPTGLGDEEDFDRCTHEFAEMYDFNIIELDKEWCTTDAVEYSYDRAKEALMRIRQG